MLAARGCAQVFVVVAKICAKEGQGDDLAGSFSAMVEWVTENEADTLTYICNRSTERPDEFVFFERYTNEKAFEAHTSSERFRDLAREIQGLLDGPIAMDTYDEVAGKL